MIEPSDAQRRIRDHGASSLLVLAPAGCGKTEALALRVAGLTTRLDSSNRVLVATFTNRARENIRERLRSHLSNHALRSRVSVSNFHGLAARIIRSHGNTLGIPTDVLMPETDWVSRQCRARGLNFDIVREVNSVLGKAKREPRSDEAVIAHLEEIGNEHAIEVEKVRQSAGQLTYDDLPRLAELILQNNAVVDLYRSHFSHVVVDEFQDLTLQQLRIVRSLGEGSTTFAGDLSQGIYSFTGAAPEKVLLSVRGEVGEAVIEFAESHRSSPAVLAMVNALAPAIGGQTLTCANPGSWPGNGVATVLQFPDVQAESDYIRRIVQGIVQRAPRHRIGVVARTKNRNRFIDSTLAGVAFNFYRWDDPILDSHASPVVKQALQRFNAAEYEVATEKLTYLVGLIDESDLQDPATRETVVDALGWVVDELRDGKTANELHKRVGVRDGHDLLNAPGIHLLTGHAGKGQQFDWVVVVGLEEGCLPDFRATEPNEILEEMRVLSVMVSRARHGVFLTNSDSVPTNYGNSRPRDPSSFLRSFADVSECTDRVGLQQWLTSVDWNAAADR